jgi:hypothetical protein
LYLTLPTFTAAPLQKGLTWEKLEESEKLDGQYLLNRANIENDTTNGWFAIGRMGSDNNALLCGFIQIPIVKLISRIEENDSTDEIIINKDDFNWNKKTFDWDKSRLEDFDSFIANTEAADAAIFIMSAITPNDAANSSNLFQDLYNRG